MLLLLPTPLVPLLVGSATSLRGVAACGGTISAERILLGSTTPRSRSRPPLVLVALGADTPSWSHWPCYAPRSAPSSPPTPCASRCAPTRHRPLPARDPARAAPGLPRRRAARPVGLLAAIAAAAAPATALLVLPLVYLLATSRASARRRIAQSIELAAPSAAPRFLLRDLLEEDDEYTGHHTEDVVELSVRVAERMASTRTSAARPSSARCCTTSARSPSRRDHQQARPLDDDEWAIMKTHTIEGQRMLDQVGGLLATSASSCAPRTSASTAAATRTAWRERTIPLAARIVARCDSFNAMTTTRSYRKALPVSHAVEELRRCSGTSVRPAVVSRFWRSSAIRGGR
jgi:hypothetical protein